VDAQLPFDDRSDGADERYYHLLAPKGVFEAARRARRAGQLRAHTVVNTVVIVVIFFDSTDGSVEHRLSGALQR
jgi:hypothetical protein